MKVITSTCPAEVVVYFPSCIFSPSPLFSVVVPFTMAPLLVNSYSFVHFFLLCLTSCTCPLVLGFSIVVAARWSSCFGDDDVIFL